VGKSPAGNAGCIMVVNGLLLAAGGAGVALFGGPPLSGRLIVGALLLVCACLAFLGARAFLKWGRDERATAEGKSQGEQKQEEKHDRSPGDEGGEC